MSSYQARGPEEQEVVDNHIEGSWEDSAYISEPIPKYQIKIVVIAHRVNH